MALAQNEFYARQYGCGHTNSGPCGRRKSRTRNVMTQTLAEGVKNIVQFCNDQKGCLGTGIRVPRGAVRGKYAGVIS